MSSHDCFLCNHKFLTKKELVNHTFTHHQATIKVYGASKLYHHKLWAALKEDWPEVTFVMRWPFKHVGAIPDDPIYARIFWQHDLDDIKEADVILVYAESHDRLRGALVEAGMGLALGKTVVTCAPTGHSDIGTWAHHPNVIQVRDLDSARLLLKCMAM